MKPRTDKPLSLFIALIGELGLKKSMQKGTILQQGGWTNQYVSSASYQISYKLRYKPKISAAAFPASICLLS
jgi:hypothetical protein